MTPKSNKREATYPVQGSSSETTEARGYRVDILKVVKKIFEQPPAKILSPAKVLQK
jgi:hypothetical protein